MDKRKDMNIKDRTVKMKMPHIFFNRAFSNGVLILVLSFSLINYVWGLIGYTSFDMMIVFLINFIAVLAFSFMAVGPGEALKEPSYSSDVDNRDVNKEDFKRMGVYLIAYTVVALLYYALYAPVYTPTPPVKDIHIQIKSVKFIDVHEKGKDQYAIRYYDKDGQNVFTDMYLKEPSRTSVYKKIFDSSGKVIVDMDYYKKNGKAFVEISNKAIQL